MKIDWTISQKEKVFLARTEKELKRDDVAATWLHRKLLLRIPHTFANKWQISEHLRISKKLFEYFENWLMKFKRLMIAIATYF